MLRLHASYPFPRPFSFLSNLFGVLLSASHQIPRSEKAKQGRKGQEEETKIEPSQPIAVVLSQAAEEEYRRRTTGNTQQGIFNCKSAVNLGCEGRKATGASSVSPNGGACRREENRGIQRVDGAVAEKEWPALVKALIKRFVGELQPDQSAPLGHGVQAAGDNFA